MSSHKSKVWLMLPLSVGTALLAGSCVQEIDPFNCLSAPGACSSVEEETKGPPRLYVDPPFGVTFDCIALGCVETRPMIIENRGGGFTRLSKARLALDASTDMQVRLYDGELTEDEMRAIYQKERALLLDDLPLAVVSDLEPIDEDELLTDEERNAILEGLVPLSPPSDDEPLLLRPNQKVTALAVYAPTDGKTDEGTYNIVWSDGSVIFADAVLQNIDLPLRTRVLGDVSSSISTPTLSFGYVPVGQTVTLPVELLNTSVGGAILAITAATFDPTTPSEYSVIFPEDTSTLLANAGDTIILPVQFTPTQEGIFVGSLYIATNDPIYPTLTVPLQATSVAAPVPALLEPASGQVNFGDVRLGTTREETIRIRNNGGTPISLTSSFVAGAEAGFSIASPTEQPLPTLNPLDEIEVAVRLTPTVGGPIHGQINFTDSSGASTSLSMDAYGLAPSGVWDVSSVEFGSLVQGWTAPAQTVHLANNGTGELTITSVEFEVGSSSQVHLAAVPPLPIKLEPNGESLDLSLLVVAQSLGRADATLLVTTDAVDNPVQRLPIRALVVTCAEGCPMNGGTPDCSAGRCEVGSCLPGRHDADQQFSSGCECEEDRQSNGVADIRGACPGSSIGTIGDDCASAPTNVTRSGTLHSTDDVDLYFFSADDGGGVFCDTFGDSFGVVVELISAPPGVELCMRAVGRGNGCGGENQRQCGQSRYTVDGSFGSDDDRDVTVWVQWAPNAAPMCGNYTVRMRADDG